MKAILAQQYGTPDVLTLEEIGQPVPERLCLPGQRSPDLPWVMRSLAQQKGHLQNKQSPLRKI